MKSYFKLVGRVMNGTKVEGYWVYDMMRQRNVYMPKDQVDELALNKCISNCTAQRYNNVVTLKGKGNDFKVQKLPKYDIYGRRVESESSRSRQSAQSVEPIYDLLYRIVNSKVTTGFLVRDLRVGNIAFLTREDVIAYANEGYIKDVRTNRSKNKFILRGNESKSIDDLPAISPDKVRSLMYR